MKKLIFLIIIAIVITGCTKEPIQEPIEENRKAADYFPFLENTKLSYAGEGNEYADRAVFFDFIEGDRAQLRMSNSGTTVAQVYEIADGAVRRLSSQEEMYTFYNTMEWLENDAGSLQAEVILMEPIEEGNQWDLGDGRTREITAVNIAVETPYSDYEAIEVTTKSDDGESVTQDYYALEIGLIKSVFTNNGIEIITILEDVERNATHDQEVAFYYPDFNNEVIVFEEAEIEFKTNDDIKTLFEEKLKASPGEGINHVLGENVKINNIVYDREDASVLVDFNRSLVTEMNAGVYLEGQILSSIANTFGGYFNVSKVFIRLDGEPYESGHAYLEEDEYITPEIEAAIPYNKE